MSRMLDRKTSHVSSATVWVKSRAKQAGHGVKQTTLKGERKMHANIAKDSRFSAYDRIKAAKHAVKAGAGEFVEGGKKKLHEQRADFHRERVLGKL